MSDKVDCRTKKSTRQERIFIIIKVSPHQEDIIILNVYIPNNKVVKCVKQKWIELKRERDKSTIIGEGSSTSVSTINSTNR